MSLLRRVVVWLRPADPIYKLLFLEYLLIGAMTLLISLILYLWF